jgi:hypothetical protein
MPSQTPLGDSRRQSRFSTTARLQGQVMKTFWFFILFRIPNNIVIRCDHRTLSVSYGMMMTMTDEHAIACPISGFTTVVLALGRPFHIGVLSEISEIRFKDANSVFMSTTERTTRKTHTVILQLLVSNCGN